MRDNKLSLSLHKNIKQSGKVFFQSSAAEQIIKIHFERLVWFVIRDLFLKDYLFDNCNIPLVYRFVPAIY